MFLKSCSRMSDDLVLFSSAHLLKPSRLSQRRKTHQEIIQLPPLRVPHPPLSLFLLCSQSIIIKRQVSIPHVSHHPLPPPPQPRCVFGISGPQRASRLDGSRCETRVFLVSWLVNQAEGEESTLRRHLLLETCQRNTYSSLSSEQSV